jgi:hypothetical protein
MFIYIKSTPSGEIVGLQSCSIEPPVVQPGFVRVPDTHPDPGSIKPDSHYINSAGEIVKYSAELFAAKLRIPPLRHTWDVQQGWVDRSTLAQVKADKTEAINFERERRGVLSITFQGIEWDADELSQRNVSAWMASIAAGVTIPTGFTWRAADNTNHPADAAFVNGLGAAITLRGTVLYQTSWGKKAEVEALTTVQAVKAYDVTTGW